MRLTIGILLIAAALSLTGCGAKQVIENLPVVGRKPDLKADLSKAFGLQADQQIQVLGGYVVLSPADANGQRTMAYVVQDGGGYKLQGKRAPVQASAQVRLDGGLLVLEAAKEGSPKFTAYKPEKTERGLVPIDYYRERAPEPAVKKGHFVLVNKHWNVLWHYKDGQLLANYMVATGKQTESPAPTWQDYKTNFFTPEGTFKLTNFAVNPPYNALKPGDKSYPGGAPGNPLGTRWMGFAVLDGDNAWVWGIHGTSEPDKIGTWVSDGCIRMNTNEAEALFSQLKGQNATLQVVGKL